MQLPKVYFQQFWRNCQSGIPATVILGSPKTKNCKNFGICQVSLDMNHNSGRCNNGSVAYLRIDPPTNRLLIHFLSCSLNEECSRRFFRSAAFRMDDDYYLPQEVAYSLTAGNESGSFFIEKGNYPVLVDDHFHTVSLRMAQVLEVEEEETPLRRAA